MERFLDMIQPLFDARLVLAVVIVICATVGLMHGRLTGAEWAMAVGATVWWSTKTDAANQKARGMR